MFHILKLIMFWSPAITLSYYILRWVIKWVIALYTATKDVAEIKYNHLPHVYKLLRKLCYKLGIDPDEGEDGFDKTGNS